MAAASAVRDRADSISTCHGRDGPDGGRAGASSSTTCALVPPRPNELTPARRGAPGSAATAAARRSRRTGCRRSRSADWARRSAGSAAARRASSASAVLIRPADAGRGVQVADVRLHRADARRTRGRGVLAEDLVSARDLDRVAERACRCRALRRRRCCRHRRRAAAARSAIDLGLAVDARRGEADLVRAVVVDRRCRG